MSKSGRRVRIFSALEVANICGVVNQTAINWIRSGYLKAFTTPGGQYRIYAKDLAAFLDTRGMSASGEVLHVMMENANWDSFMIVADDSVNDSLKAEIETLFPNYTVIQAYDWFEAGKKITEKKPGFILLDVDLPGVDAAKFIHTVKSDPIFGKPFILLLAEGNTSVRGDVVLRKPLDLKRLETVIKDLKKQLEIQAFIA